MAKGVPVNEDIKFKKKNWLHQFVLRDYLKKQLFCFWLENSRAFIRAQVNPNEDKKYFKRIWLY